MTYTLEISDARYTSEKTEARRRVCFPKVTNIQRWSSVLTEMFLCPKTTSCLGVTSSCLWVDHGLLHSCPLCFIQEIALAWTVTMLERLSHPCWKLFIGCLFLYAFFFFLLHSFSLEPLGIFLFTLDQFRRCFFLLFLGQALLFQACGYDSCFLYCAWPSHCVWQLFNCRHSPRHTLSACVVGWVALHYSRGYTHTHTCIHAGWVLYRNGIV